MADNITLTNSGVSLRVETQTDDPQGANTSPQLSVSNSTITARAQTSNNGEVGGVNGTLILDTSFVNGSASAAQGLLVNASGDGSLQVTDSHIYAHTDAGVRFTGGSIDNTQVNNSCIYSNVNFGAFSDVNSLNAENNWWGATDGPSDAGPGSGDAVNASVLFNPFDTTAPTVAGVECPEALPIYSSNPAAGSTLALGPGGSASFDVTNTGDSGSLLDVSVSSVSAGYTVSGLPITGLQPDDAAQTVTIACEVPTADGTLVVTTNETDSPTYTYTLTCVAAPTATPDAGNTGGDGGQQTDTDTGTTTDTTVSPTPSPLESVEQLPATGETPWWRDWVIALLGGGMVLGGAGLAWRQQGAN